MIFVVVCIKESESCLHYILNKDYTRGDTMWEYKTETFNSIFDTKSSLKRKCNAILEKCGNEDWELVNFQCAGGGSMMILVFKRAK